MNDPVAVATFLLALATFALALFTFRMARETKQVATATARLAAAAQEQLRTATEQVGIAREELSHLQEQTRASQEPQVVVENDGETVTQVPQRAGMELFYLYVKVRLANYGGHAVIERLHVTGTPRVETRPLDVAGFLPSGGRLPFELRFDVGNAASDLKASASIPIRARALRLTEWKESLFFVNVQYSLGGGGESAGWRAEVRQPLNLN